MSSSLTSTQLARKAIQEANRNSSALTSRNTSADAGLWTDAKLKDIVAGIKIPDLQDQEVDVMFRFMEFYLSGNIRKQDSVIATIIDPIFLLKCDKEPVFRGGSSTADRWYPANVSTGGFSSAFVASTFSGLSAPANITDSTEQKAYMDLLGTFTNSDVEALKAETEATLKKNPDDMDFKIFRNLVVSLALVALRAVSKDAVSIRNAYAKNQFRTNLANLITYDVSRPFCPPSPDFVKKVVMSFGNTNLVVRNIFALIVNVAIEDKNCPKGSLVYKAIFDATVLTHTSRTGMGMVTLLSHAAEVTEWDWVMIMERTMTDLTMKAWNALSEYVSHSHVKGDAVASAPWARIISDSHNRGLSPKDNKNLAVCLAACAESVLGKGIWTAEWSKAIGNDYEDMKLLGKALFHKSRPDISNIKGDAGYDDIILQAQAWKKSGKASDVLGHKTALIEEEKESEEMNEDDFD